MSSKTYVGRLLKQYKESPALTGFSRVVIEVSEDVSYSAGVDTGRTLTIVNPFGTQQIADNILSLIRGYQYQPYTADNAILDPAAELGDGITVGNTYSGIYSQENVFGGIYRSTISAPSDEEIDHEYPYKNPQTRKISRNFQGIRTELKIQNGLISAEAEARQNDVTQLTSQLTLQAKNIEAKVSKTGGSESSFGWVLDDSSWTIKANGRDILKATKSGLEVYGKITATSGTIGGFTINSNSISYNSQTWGGTNTTGIYIGPNGIQLGNSFKVDAMGNLTAANGTFSGSVRADMISHGENNGGYLSGTAISPYSISGGDYGQIAGSTLSTVNMTKGVNDSLGFADFSHSVFSGNTKATAVSAFAVAGDTVIATTLRVSEDLYFGGIALYLGSISDGNGNIQRVVQWKG